MNLLDIALILFKRRWKIFKFVTFFTLTFLVISLIITKKYKGTASIVPLNQDASGISSLLGGYSLDVFGKGVVIPESYSFILNSTAFKDSLIKRFNLFEVYDLEYKEHVYKKLSEVLEVEVDKVSGIGYAPIVGIKIHAIDELPERAMNMANFSIKFLNQKVSFFNKTYYDFKYKYIESRYNKSIEDLYLAESKLKVFQEKYGVLQLEEQYKAFVGVIAELETEKKKLEFELQVIMSQVDKSSFMYKETKNKLQILSKQISDILNKESISNESMIFLPKNLLPQIASQYLQLYRDVEVQNKIYEMITIQYEQTKMQLDRDIPQSLILDYSTLPTYKDSPKRLLIVLSGFLISLIIAILFSIINHFYSIERAKKSGTFSKVEEIKTLITSDLNKLKNRFGKK